MRHRRRTRKLGRKTAHRQMMLRNLVTSLIEHGRVVTTVPKAKEVRRIADKMVTLAKSGTLHARRQILSMVTNKKVVTRLYERWAKQMADKTSGYTRIVRIGPRRGDAAMMCYLEFAVDALERIKAKRPGSAKKEPVETQETIIPQAVPEVSETREAEKLEGEPVEKAEAAEAVAEKEAEAEKEFIETQEIQKEQETASSSDDEIQGVKEEEKKDEGR